MFHVEHECELSFAFKPPSAQQLALDEEMVRRPDHDSSYWCRPVQIAAFSQRFGCIPEMGHGDRRLRARIESERGEPDQINPESGRESKAKRGEPDQISHPRLRSFCPAAKRRALPCLIPWRTTRDDAAVFGGWSPPKLPPPRPDSRSPAKSPPPVISH